MNLWKISSKIKSQVAVIEDKRNSKTEYTYSQLAQFISKFGQINFDEMPRRLGFIYCKNNMATLISYLAALNKKQVICLLDSTINEVLNEKLIKLYEPDWIWAPDDLIINNFQNSYNELGYCFRLNMKKKRLARSFSPELAVLLPTSGTTGSPKMVRLSYQNLQANAESISTYLNILSSHRAITTLPLQYSYGLSIINSHLIKGASLVLTEKSVVKKQFWDLFNRYKVTSFAGVPFTYEILNKIGFLEKDYSSLQMMTQAGGRLDTNLKKKFQKALSAKNIDFFVMYGQTEATARISYVPPNQLSEKIDSIGIPIPNGKLDIDSETSELIYTGPNVMLGYAESWQDLIKEDELKGNLKTGDLAICDEDGFYYIVGRKKRFIKLFGLRINLDDIERFIESNFKITVYSVGNDEKVAIVGNAIKDADAIKNLISKTYKIPIKVVQVLNIDGEIPRLSNGKVDYNQLWEKVQANQSNLEGSS
ncbi:AMP-binding protein [Metabacillus arenae]|uniref:AMP-binding protein n=1 Tax=Metabacillus arenae TaxID=2771434 RepID=A0A926RZ71_9BACI|nr:AMP-binding protein [Metabacillus arenae]MBD1381932.1 AMP-binding protein [Metabacillus arenae]